MATGDQIREIREIRVNDRLGLHIDHGRHIDWQDINMTPQEEALEADYAELQRLAEVPLMPRVGETQIINGVENTHIGNGIWQPLTTHADPFTLEEYHRLLARIFRVQANRNEVIIEPYTERIATRTVNDGYHGGVDTLRPYTPPPSETPPSDKPIDRFASGDQGCF